MLQHAALPRVRQISLPSLRPEWITLGVVLFFLVFCNVPFWGRLLTVQPLNAANALGLIAVFTALLAALNLLLTLLAWPFVLRPILTVLLIATAFVAYFMNQYGVMIDVGMLRNAMETDAAETRDLLTFKMAGYVLLLGALPVWLLWRVPIHWRPAKREVLTKSAVIAVSLSVLAIVAFAYFQTFASVARNHRELRFLLTPVNYLQATSSYFKRLNTKPATLEKIGTDAKLGAAWAQRTRKSLTVIVVGETARADHFSLNGYARETNPALAKQPGLINMNNVWSCGTATAVSLPCMFSGLGRENFSLEKAQQREGLLDVLQRAGLAVQWRDNQSGCKGVCDRVPNDNLKDSKTADLCSAEECFDEVLLSGLPEKLATLDRDTVLVLHMMGSHGPAYYKRYPDRFEVFLPTCKTSQLDRCSQQEITNTFDNTLRYTDFVLAKLVEILREHADKVDTAMIYMSDHGESLGEHNLYLHGTPYMIAPDAQKHVPMLMWFSAGYQRNFGVDTACLAQNQAKPYSHDNLFHSALGLLNVTTSQYDAKQDIFNACRKNS